MRISDWSSDVCSSDLLIPGWATEHRDALRELNREITAQTLDQPIDRVNARFGTIPGIGSYLEEMREDLLDNVHALLQFETAGNTAGPAEPPAALRGRSEEHTSELQSLMRISYAVFCLKKKKYEINKIKQN